MAKRLESAQTETRAVSLVKDVLNELNWVCNPLIEDFGIDLHVKVFESAGQRRALPWEFHIQVKGSKRLRRDGAFVFFRVDTAHLRDWSESRLPVLFVVCDVPRAAGFWLLVKEYLDTLDTGWEERGSLTLRIPEGNRVTREGLLSVLGQIRRRSFVHEAAGVIALMETPPEVRLYSEQFWVPTNNPYRQPLPAPNAAIRDLALACCIACENYFWIDESFTDGHGRLVPGEEDMPENLDFAQIYSPRAHEPAVYCCDSPEEFCPFCSTGYGAFCGCERCGKYNVPYAQDLDDWDDPLVTRKEAEEACAECLDSLRAERRSVEIS